MAENLFCVLFFYSDVHTRVAIYNGQLWPENLALEFERSALVTFHKPEEMLRK